MNRTTKRLLLDLTLLGTPGGARGIGRYTRELARGLSELPPDELDGIELLALLSLNWNGNYTVTSNIAEFLARAPTSLHQSRDYYSWAYRQRLVMWQAASALRAAAVHLCDPHATPRFLGLAGTKRIVTCHDIVPTRFPEHYFGWRDGGAAVGRWIEGQRYRTADLVVAVSDATKHDICSLAGVREERVTRVYNGVDVDQWTAEPPRASERILDRYQLSSCPFLLYVGGADWRKNTEGMMRALALLRQSGAGVVLAWAGHLDASHLARVQGKAAEAGVAEAVRYLGHVTDDELSTLYRAAVAHLFVSRLEGFGLTVVEAMASGCPVVTTDAGSLAEVAGDAALKVDPESPEAIADAVRKLLSDRVLRSELIDRGKKRAPRFSRLEQARATARAYRSFFATL
jgi:glycosyltransferase involved in cell wall biosynthesis